MVAEGSDESQLGAQAPSGLVFLPCRELWPRLSRIPLLPRELRKAERGTNGYLAWPLARVRSAPGGRRHERRRRAYSTWRCSTEISGRQCWRSLPMPREPCSPSSRPWTGAQIASIQSLGEQLRIWTPAIRIIGRITILSGQKRGCAGGRSVFARIPDAFP